MSKFGIDKFSALRSRIDLFNSYAEAYSEILEKTQSAQGSVIVSFANAHAFNLAVSSPSFFNNLQNSTFLLRDGVGVKLDLTIHRSNPGANLNGTDFIPYFISKSLKDRPESKIMLIGATPINCEAATKKLSTCFGMRFFGIDGYKDFGFYKNQITLIQPDIIILGMGMPKQEELASFIQNNTSRKSLIFNGGAIIDFISGNIPRAPSYLRNSGLEWLFRLYIEPRRLFKRYFFGNCKFALYSISSKLFTLK